MWNIAVRAFNETPNSIKAIWDGFSVEVSEPSPPATDETESFVHYIYGWDRALAFRRRPGNRAPTQQLEQWAHLVQGVHTLLADDVAWLVANRTFRIHNLRARDALEEIERTIRHQSRSTRNSWNWLLHQPLSSAALTWIRSDSLNHEYLRRRTAESFDDFVQAVEADVDSYIPSRNFSVRQTSAGVFKLPISSITFTSPEARRAIAATFQEFWTTGELHAELEWIFGSALSNSGTAWIEKSLTPGSRSFYNFGDMTITLFPPTSMRVLVHELGHALGLPDDYFTRFDARNCRYTVEVSNTSLMGNHQAGRVLARHWAKLNELYPVRP